MASGSGALPDRTQQILESVRHGLGIRDIGVVPRWRAVYLLSSARSLNSLMNSWFLRGWEIERRGHTLDRTWLQVRDTLLEILDEKGAPVPRRSDTCWVDEWEVIPVPSPGGPQSRWWSVRRGRWMPAVKVAPVDLCMAEPVPFGSAHGPVLLSNTDGSWPPIFVSHGVGLHDLGVIRRCGGLRWPSFAVTWKIPPSYGDVVFLADARTLTGHLRPEGRSGGDVVITATDSWSPNSMFLDKLELALTHELRGDHEWWSGNMSNDLGGWGRRDLQDKLLHGESLSTIIQEYDTGWMPSAAWGTVRNMRTVWSRIRKLVRFHTERSGLYDYEPKDELNERAGEYSVRLRRDMRDYRSEGIEYAYLEMKVAGMVAPSDLAACLYPSRYKRRVFSFLDAAGFRGWRIPFRYDGPPSAEAGGSEKAVWAGSATAALLSWAADPCGARGVTRPPGIIADLNTRYVATADWSSRPIGFFGGHLRWSPGYCRGS